MVPMSELRKRACSHLLSHADDFLPFFIAASDGDSDATFQEYCEKIRDTGVWGGQMEIQALAIDLAVAIHVVQADGTIVRMNENGSNGNGKDGDESNPVLWISYHKHEYGLGEHYNSLVDNTNK